MRRQRLLGWVGAIVVAMMTAACAQSDTGITTAVKSKLAGDDTVKAYRIDVDTQDRVVTLTGDVNTEAGKARAIELAKNTAGVRDVVDRLTVAPGAAPTTGVDDAQKRGGEAADKSEGLLGDPGITAAVKTKLLADSTV